MTPHQPSPTVVHHADRQRFEIRLTEHLAFLSYQHAGGRVVLDHTYVPHPLRGRGLANTLALAALEEARRQGWKVVPACSFVSSFVDRHPEFTDLLDRPGAAGTAME
jgi:uncharacterized protein